MDYKKLGIVISFYLLGLHFIAANKNKTQVYVVFNTASCHQCNIQLNYYLTHTKGLKRRVQILTLKDNNFYKRRASEYFPKFKVKYDNTFLNLLPDSLTNSLSLKFPFVTIVRDDSLHIIPYNQLFSAIQLDTALLNKYLIVKN